MTDVPVTQADRDAACTYLSEIAGLRGAEAVTEIRDDHPTLLAFARHRIEGERSARLDSTQEPATGELQRRAQILAWVSEAIKLGDKSGNTHGIWLFAKQWRTVAAALRTPASP